MDSLRSTPPTDQPGTDSPNDLSTVSWVVDELRRSLEQSLKSLRRQLKESQASDSDVDAVDPSILSGARQNLHQCVGALEMVGLHGASVVLKACETAVIRFVSKPKLLDANAIAAIEGASFALLDYIGRLLAGKKVSALSMFPQYRAVQEVAGADRVHPADLWGREWHWQSLPTDDYAESREPDEHTRSAIESKMLALMRKPTPGAARRMSDICAGLGAGSSHAQTATLWKLAAAMFEAQSQGLLSPDVFSKRIASRLLAQLRILERGGSEVSERLAEDLLFFCAQAHSPGAGRNAPRLAAVRQAYNLVDHVNANYHTSALGRFDPALIAQARKRVGAAKESWSAVAAGEMHRVNGLVEQFSLAGESLARLFPSGDGLAEELRLAAAQTVQSATPPSAPLAMEAATSLLYVEACLEDAEFDHPELGNRVQRMTERMATVRQGGAPHPLEGWMEDLYRRVSDRQTMGSVVQELRSTLSDAEKSIDQFFRNPADAQVLLAVPNLLGSMRGVLSVLGMDQASSALLRMRDEVDGLISTEIDLDRVSQAGVFDHLAGNLGALGFLIDMLSVQPTLAKTLFVYDAESGSLGPVMGLSERAVVVPGEPVPAPAQPRLIEQAQMLAFNAARDDVSIDSVARDLERLSHEATAADQTALAATVSRARVALQQATDEADISAARDQLSESLADFVHSSPEPSGLAGSVQPSEAALPDDEDEEMLEVFLEEAREVMDAAGSARTELVDSPADLEHLTVLRRAFHTLKGSARMVDLTEFGNAAWVGEQLYNSRLSEQQPADARLLDFTGWALEQLSAWVDDIAARRATTQSSAEFESAAAQLAEPLQAPPASPAVIDSADHPAGEVAAAESAHDWAEPVPTLPTRSTAWDSTDIFPPEMAAAAAAAADVPTPAPSVAGLLVGLDLDVSSPGAIDARAVDPVTIDLSDASPKAGLIELPLDHGLADPGVAALDLDAGASSEMFEPFDPQMTQPLAIDALPYAGEQRRPFGSTNAPAPVDLPIESDPPQDLLDSEPLIHSEEPGAVDTDVAANDESTLPADAEDVKIIGSLRVSIPLFNIYLNEADELSRRLVTEIAEWSLELDRPIDDSTCALAHSLAGNSATVGFTELSQLARTLEHALSRAAAFGYGTPDEAQLFGEAAEEIRRLLHQFAAGFLKSPAQSLLDRLAEHELSSAHRLDTAASEFEVRSEPQSDDASLPVAALIDTPLVIEPFEYVPVAQEPAYESPASELVVNELSESEPPAVEHLAFAPSLADPVPADALAILAIEEQGASLEAPAHPIGELTRTHAFDDEDGIDAIDAIDEELFPIFEEEAEDLLGQLANRLQEWSWQPGDMSQPAGAMRALHTLKGGARLAGAMRLGELVHRLESRIEQLTSASSDAPAAVSDIEPLLGRSDALRQAFERLKKALHTGLPADALLSASAPSVQAASAVAVASAVAEADSAAPIVSHEAATEEPSMSQALDTAPESTSDVSLPSASETLREDAYTESAIASGAAIDTEQAIDWSRFGSTEPAAPRAPATATIASAVRVRAPLLDRLVNQAGEVSIMRSRIASDVDVIRDSLADLTENLERLRGQLHDIELQAETQISSRMEAARSAAEAFDPLEFDRYTRFQELTRMMAESVNDVATVQRTLQRSLQSTEDELAAQARLTRELQDDLLRTRMVEFESLSDRLYRVVRQAAKETGKQVRLDLVGGSIELDRGVLDRMTGAFEHLLRNSVTHGIEAPADRTAAGKDVAGAIGVSVSQDGNEVSVEVRDDGCGLNLDRIRAKALGLGLIQPDAVLSEAQLVDLIFTPGFSTADKVTELAGRGIGMDVVRSEVNAIGGRIETASAPGQGTSFKLVLPLTTAVTQVVMVRCGELTVGLPSTLVDAVRRVPSDVVDAAYQQGVFVESDETLPFYWLGALLQNSARSAEPAGRMRQVIVIRSASQRVAIHVDDVAGNQEVVVKNLGPQLSRMPGLAGMTLLASGKVALIYNPVALATLYGQAARSATLEAASLSAAEPAGPEADAMERLHAAPLVLVVDDSITVRRVTERMLVREGYRVMLAKDGLDAIERLAQEKPAVVLSDIEMPRMDGFDLVRNLRADIHLKDLPVIMITSRIAQKHRDHAAQLGVNHYLGKPYSEEDLIALIALYAPSRVAA
jgi:chemosensory pili system protein ChpA (sensor histidine kinase/response regulator)